MKRFTQLLLAASLLGVLSGAAVAEALPDQEERCDRIEDLVRQEGNVSGVLACFPPDVIETNVSEPVQEGSKPICLCRRYLDGEVDLSYIGRAASP